MRLEMVRKMRQIATRISKESSASTNLQTFIKSCQVLADIELAQSLQAEKEEKPKMEDVEVPHPLDEDYNLLKCDLSLVPCNDEEFKVNPG